MNSPATFVVGCLLLVGGLALARSELGGLRRINEAELAQRPYLRARGKRRFRIGVLLTFVGLAMAGASWIDAERRPLAFLFTWIAALLAALWLLWLGMIDFFGVRLHWVDETQRNLADIARTRAELKKHERHDRNGHAPQ